MIRPIHPFPARMAPELALEKLNELPWTGLVLDPMAGSGTVVRQACDLGHKALGFDMDPLAVLMTRVWTTPIADEVVAKVAEDVVRAARDLSPFDAKLPWIDDDTETEVFVRYWFGDTQCGDLRRLAFVLDSYADASVSDDRAAADVLRIALSRIIVTKDKGASLARDVSHSRPHKMAETSDFEVLPAFERSVKTVRRRLKESPPRGGAAITLGDARSLQGVGDASVDAVLTSPPYLNAIDYLRGHRLSLVWLGHRLHELRTIRSNSIGSERAPAGPYDLERFGGIRAAMGNVDELPARFGRIVDRYVEDLYRMVAEVARVLKAGARATFVIGNSCLRTVFIRNSEAVATAARLVGLRLVGRDERELPARHRYLPLTTEGLLGKRMRTESILSFVRV